MAVNRNHERATSGAIAVTTTAQKFADFQAQRSSVSFRNAGSTTIYFGKDATVTTSNGYPLLADEEYEFTDYSGPLYAITATTGDLRYFEVF